MTETIVTGRTRLSAREVHSWGPIEGFGLVAERRCERHDRTELQYAGPNPFPTVTVVDVDQELPVGLLEEAARRHTVTVLGTSMPDWTGGGAVLQHGGHALIMLDEAQLAERGVSIEWALAHEVGHIVHRGEGDEAADAWAAAWGARS